jgi:uncharacterized protein (DUF488 family)
LGVIPKSPADPSRPGWPAVLTIGHSTRSREEFQRLLLAHQISTLVDVRSFPGSRRYPHFNQTELAADLHIIGIAYHHLKSLGGRRKLLSQSKNTAWQNASFRAYADHMDSDEFKRGITDLLALAQQQRTAIMCAEAVWWRCHRGLIADYLKVNGTEVIHIIDVARTESHPFTTAARIVDGELSYQGLLPG